MPCICSCVYVAPDPADAKALIERGDWSWKKVFAAKHLLTHKEAERPAPVATTLCGLPLHQDSYKGKVTNQHSSDGFLFVGSRSSNSERPVCEPCLVANERLYNKPPQDPRDKVW